MNATENNTFRNLLVLKEAREVAKAKLGEKYNETVTLFINIIFQVMKANDINEFEAMLKIKNELSLYKKDGAPILFSSALIEIVENKYFDELNRQEEG